MGSESKWGKTRVAVQCDVVESVRRLSFVSFCPPGQDASLGLLLKLGCSCMHIERVGKA